MPTGIQCWDDSGNLTLDLSSSLVKTFGQASVGNSHTGGAANGTITDSRFTAYAGHVPFAFAQDGLIDVNGNTCEFSFSGNVLTWSFPNGAGGPSYTRPDTTFVYGIMESA